MSQPTTKLDRTRKVLPKLFLLGITIFLTIFLVWASISFLLMSEDKADFFFALGAILLAGIYALFFQRRLCAWSKEFSSWANVLAGFLVLLLVAAARYLWSQAFDGRYHSVYSLAGYVALLTMPTLCAYLTSSLAAAVLFRKHSTRGREQTPPKGESLRQPQWSRGALVSRLIARVGLPLVVAAFLVTLLLIDDTVGGWLALSAVVLVPAWVLLSGKIRSRLATWPLTIIVSVALFPLARYVWWLCFERNRGFADDSLFWLAITAFMVHTAADSAKEIFHSWKHKEDIQKS